MKIEPETRFSLLVEIQKGRIELEKSLLGFTEQQMFIPGVEPGWSLKDLVLHIIAWEKLMCGWVEDIRDGHTPDRPPPGETWGDLDGFNQRIYMENQDIPLETCREMLRNSLQKVLSQISQTPEKELFDGSVFEWTRGEPLWYLVAANTFWHYEEHINSVIAWKEQLSDSTKRIRPVKEFASEHFFLQQVAENAFAAIASPGGGAFSNAGIVDIGDKTIIFDAMETPQAGSDLKKAAIFLTGRDPEFLILSHKHHDHWGGSGEFLDVPIFMTAPQIKMDMVHEAEEIQNNPEEMQQDLEKWQEEIRNAITEAVNPEEETFLRHKLERSDYVLKSLVGIRFAVPNLTCEEKITISGTRREVEIVNTGPGHTSCDLSLILPDEGVCFLGDLGFFDCHPFMFDASPARWKQTLLDLTRTEVESYIPGHGRVGTGQDLLLLVDYFDTLTETTKELIASEFPEERRN